MTSSGVRNTAVQLDRRAPRLEPAPVLDDRQAAVVDHREGHLLVLAGPGTGKTTTLAELIVSRVRDASDPLPPESVLALTFGRRAARELADRISRRLGGGPLPVVSTFHSFAYGVLRQYADPAAFLHPPRLLTAAEQDARLRELLTWSVAEGRLEWPSELAGAMGTRGIAEQVRALLARARGLGLDGPTLARFGRSAGVPAWTAVGTFFQEYLDTMGFEGSLDYAELIHQAVALASKEAAGRALRESYRLVVVDEYQDTDPAQVRLLRELARGGAQVIAVGDPDQAIYGFRGADVGGILRFAEQFADPISGAPARIEVLRNTRRFPRPVAAAAQRVLGPVPLTGLPVEAQRRHRSPIAADRPALVEAHTYPSGAAEAAGVAELLLAAHAGSSGVGPLAWSDMAVLVRNPAVQGPAVARALRVAGIPVAMPPDELALGDEPAVQVLTGVIELALEPAAVPADAGRVLLAGPIGRAGPVAIRALARALLQAQSGTALAPSAVGRRSSTPGVAVAPSTHSGEPPRVDGVAPEPMDSDALLTAAVATGELPDLGPGSELPDEARAAFERVSLAVAAARASLDRGDPVSDVLWAAWTASDWPERLRATALRGGFAAVAADRDLDAMVSLFDAANRLPVQRSGPVGVSAFLSEVRAMLLPGRAGGDAGQLPGQHVKLLSAHRAKGLEWELVVVAGVQEGLWPDVRLRSDLLRVGELGPRGRLDQRSHADLLAEERRLMYVACTRARSALVVTAVAEPVDGGAQPSRFLADLGVPVQAMATRAAQPMSGPGLLAALRRAACAPPSLREDGRPDLDVEALREAAVQRLAALAAQARRGALGGRTGAIGGADPRRWWGVRAVTSLAGAELGQGGVPGEAAASSDVGLLVRLSPSAVEALRTCPLRWFLERRAGARSPHGTPATIGQVVHALAEALGRGELPADPDALGAAVDEIWSAMPFAARYQSAHQRERVGHMIASLLLWHAGTDRQVQAVEAPFRLELPTADGLVRVSGVVDRVDRGADGRLHLVDFKTGQSAASAAAAAEHPQLGIYQLAVREGALALASDEPASDGPGAAASTARSPVGGAELVHLGDRYRTGMPKVRRQDPLPEGATWVHALILDAARLAAGPSYPARRNGRCGTCAFQPMCPARLAASTSGAVPGEVRP